MIIPNSGTGSPYPIYYDPCVPSRRVVTKDEPKKRKKFDHGKFSNKKKKFHKTLDR